MKPAQLANGEVIDARLEAACARGAVARQKLVMAEGGSISESEAVQLVGFSRGRLQRAYREGRVLAWKDGNEIRFPIWQFQGNKILPGISKVICILNRGSRLNDIGRMLFFLSQFGPMGCRPIDLLHEGRINDALQIARAYMDT